MLVGLVSGEALFLTCSWPTSPCVLSGLSSVCVCTPGVSSYKDTSPVGSPTYPCDHIESYLLFKGPVSKYSQSGCWGFNTEIWQRVSGMGRGACGGAQFSVTTPVIINREAWRKALKMNFTINHCTWWHSSRAGSHGCTTFLESQGFPAAELPTNTPA